jgi:hypothetical protein
VASTEDGLHSGEIHCLVPHELQTVTWNKYYVVGVRAWFVV